MELYNKNIDIKEKKYSELSMIELTNLINQVKTKHDSIKESILAMVSQVEELENMINNDLIKLREFEDQYIQLIEELNNR
jgi:hypothetical protein